MRYNRMQSITRSLSTRACSKCKLVYCPDDLSEYAFHQAVCISVQRLLTAEPLTGVLVNTPRGLRSLFSPRSVSARTRVFQRLIEHESQISVSMLAAVLFVLKDMAREMCLLRTFSPQTRLALEPLLAERLLHNGLHLDVESVSKRFRLHVLCTGSRGLLPLVVYDRTTNHRAGELMHQQRVDMQWERSTMNSLHEAYWMAHRTLLVRLCIAFDYSPRQDARCDGALPAAFFVVFRNTHWLSAKRCCITAIPTSIGQMRYLVDLHLSNNSLTSLPDELSELRNLETLDVSHNQLASLPKDADRLVSLRRADFSYNALEEFPLACAVFWTNLEQLNLYSNRIRLLPVVAMARMPVLSELKIGANYYVHFPEQLYTSTSLRYINIANNKPAFTDVSIGCIEHDTILTIK